MKRAGAVLTLLLVLLCAREVPSADSCVEYAKSELEGKYPRAFGAGATVRGPISVLAIERDERTKIAACSHCPQKPFGYMHAKWEKFKNQIRPGDCIVFFRSDQASWKALAGVEGYVLMRGKKLILEILTRIS
jgi:hypothetical protein